jgi:hypothetical protein
MNRASHIFAPGHSLRPTPAGPAISTVLLAALVVGCAVPTGAAPSAAPSAARVPATATAPTTPESTAASSPGAPLCPQDQPLAAGTYAISPEQSEMSLPITMTVTAGWKGCGLTFKELGDPGGLMMVGFWDVRNVYADPCRWKGGLFDPPVGPRVEDLAKALVDQARTEAKPATDITLDGFSGKYVRLEVPADLDTAACDRDQIAEFRFFNGIAESVWWLGAAEAPGLIGEVWIVDIHGTRAVVQGASFMDARAEDREEIHRLVESIDFGP